MKVTLQERALIAAGFSREPSPEGFGPLWRSYRVQNERCQGWFHSLSPEDEPWSVSIHDFVIRDDFVMNFDSPRYLTVTWFRSIAGEEFSPYRKLRPNSIWGQSIGGGPWRGVAHGGIPVQSVSIEVTPEFSARFLDLEYEGKFRNVEKAFVSLGRNDEFPEMKALLSGLWPQPGDEGRSKLFYGGKVLEAMSLIVERTRREAPGSRRAASPADCERIHDVVCYIDDHCAADLRVPDLAAMACMSPTKFKSTFKLVTGMTVIGYVQSRRMSQAEQLMRRDDLTIGQIAHAVGYACAGRFSAVFKREVGMLPSEFRKSVVARRCQGGEPNR